MTQTETSRRPILREDEFLPLLQDATKEFGEQLIALIDQPAVLGQISFMGHFCERSNSLELFMDDYGARQNRAFVTFGELVASLRGLGLVKATGLHLISRLPRYATARDNLELVAELGSAHATLDRAIARLAAEAVTEASKLGLSWKVTEAYAVPAVALRRQLPRDLDADLADDERQHIAQLGARFLAVLQASRSLGLEAIRPSEELTEFVRERASEDRCRWYESAVHNIQSMYDTYVLGTALEKENDWLLVLRGHTSIALHLLEMATGLVHFYERHENDLRHEVARELISRVVDKGDVLHIAVNVCLRQAYLYVEGCSSTAKQILDTFVVDRALALPLPDGVVLHARPLALIVQIARHHGTPLEVEIEGEACSASSLMSLIMLGGAHPTPAEIVFRGDARSLEDVRALFEVGLGESVGVQMPPQLGYLRIKV
ncbi:MAG: hypothetical protein DHS20C15_18120 [Planctomycetota bacterium]|nr:MAG: hypothetical protein DHS20C15_18120 [Planctomycetota bacterium]